MDIIEKNSYDATMKAFVECLEMGMLVNIKEVKATIRRLNKSMNIVASYVKQNYWFMTATDVLQANDRISKYRGERNACKAILTEYNNRLINSVN